MDVEHAEETVNWIFPEPELDFQTAIRLILNNQQLMLENQKVIMENPAVLAKEIYDVKSGSEKSTDSGHPAKIHQKRLPIRHCLILSRKSTTKRH